MRSYQIDNAFRQVRRFVFKDRKKDLIGRHEFDQTYALYEDVAQSLGLQYRDFGRCKEISDGSRSFQFWMDCTEFCTFPLVGTTEDKPFVAQHLAANGLPAPPGRAFEWRDEDDALDYGMSLGDPFVIKPASDTQGGLGVFANLVSRAQARAAFRRTSAIADRVLVERYVAGENFRVLIYKGECLSVLHRRRPRVIGDGVSTIAQLVDGENQRRIRNAAWRVGDPPFAPLVLDGKALRRLAVRGFSAAHAPAMSETITLSDICNYSQGATLSEVMGDFNPTIIEGAIKAARLFGAPLAGIDVIAPSLDSDAYCINELNVGPGLQMHYLLDNPEQGRDPIRIILKDVFGLA